MQDRKITHYICVTNWKKKEFDKEVSDYLEEGYQPFGGISVSHGLQGDPRYSQAMVRYN